MPKTASAIPPIVQAKAAREAIFFARGDRPEGTAEAVSGGGGSH